MGNFTRVFSCFSRLQGLEKASFFWLTNFPGQFPRTLQPSAAAQTQKLRTLATICTFRSCKSSFRGRRVATDTAGTHQGSRFRVSRQVERARVRSFVSWGSWNAPGFEFWRPRATGTRQGSRFRASGHVERARVRG